ncbi:MAG: hypothetical protein ABFS12_08885 [Bacteroidota bacterium]
MKTMKNKIRVASFTALLMILCVNSIIAQANLDNIKLHDSKTFAKNKINVVQSHYLNKDGIPSYDQFLLNHGLNPKNQVNDMIPYFSFSVSQKSLSKEDGKLILDEDAVLLNLDFHIENISRHSSENEALIIWDGRVYAEDDELIVGGYSSKYNERPVGKINGNGVFIPELKGDVSKEFPILQLKTEQIIFDPFKWHLLQIEPSDSKNIQKITRQFLPINMFSISGGLLRDIKYQLKKNKKTSSLQLNGIVNNKIFEIANCSLSNFDVVKTKEPFRPELIEGCSQLGDDDFIKLTVKATFSENITLKGKDIYLVDDMKSSTEDAELKPGSITVDGDFKDWRNISGISDVEGDYVSYLYENPDTDLLEFKLSNDEKYLYLYSRVVGAHGRTGEKGRYYWYAYIDVDTDPKTGYPPTRDDNCYFGIPIGDDSEAQFEFIGNKFIKTFFGFTGIGAEKEVLSGTLELGPSFYSSKDRDGNKRDKYKIEYVNREGSRFITHDYTEGTSEDIIIALSPDGSEVEMKVELDGFLKDISGSKLMHLGKKIDIAVGVEGSSDHYGTDTWGADSSPVIYGYEIK